MKTTGAGSLSRIQLQGTAGTSAGPAAPSARGSSNAVRASAIASSAAARQLPPARRRGRRASPWTSWPRSARARRRWRGRRRATRRARPTVRPARLRWASASQRFVLPARPVTREHDLEDELDARFRDARLAGPARPGDGRRRPLPCLVVDDEVGVLLADRRRRRCAWPLRPRPSMSAPAESPSRIAEHAAGRRQAQRLVLLAPAADLVEALGDHVRLGRLEIEARPGDDVGRVAGCRA